MTLRILVGMAFSNRCKGLQSVNQYLHQLGRLDIIVIVRSGLALSFNDLRKGDCTTAGLCRLR